MPYTATTLQQFIAQIGVLMDDPTAVYWTVPEIQGAVYEGMRVWGAYTNYWRARGAFMADTTTPYFDLSVKLPTLRTRITTLDQVVRQIQYMLLENPGGLSGVGMSGQVSIQSILTAIEDARNRLVIDSRLPVSLHTIYAPAPVPDGLVTELESSVYVHRLSWTDGQTGLYTNLWRQDEYAMDKSDYAWTANNVNPRMYSESQLAPLQLQLMPRPVNDGTLEAFTVDSLQMDLTDPNTTFNIPDEWIHAVLYAALSQILSSEGQIKDTLRAQYAEQRYQQALEFARGAVSVTRLMCNDRPLNLDSLAAIDAGLWQWRNTSGPPNIAGALYDFVVISPGVLDGTYGITADVAQSAPLPQLNQPIQMGAEEMDGLKDYVCHVLSFKCGGQEFKDSMSGFDSFMKNANGRKAINTAKITNLVALFGQPQLEWSQRPDKIEKGV